MKKIIVSAIGIIGFLFLAHGSVFAQGMTDNSIINSDDHTVREEAEGKIIWEKLSRPQGRGSSTESGQVKETACADLSDEDYAALGEYFMGLMLGESHPAMNAMMMQMMGEDGEEAMHAAMGKRFSGCDANAAFPAGDIGFIPMMSMMMGGRSTPFGGFNTHMMGIGYGGYGFGALWMLFWWVLVIALIIFLVRWAMRQVKGEGGRSAIEILKERYAKGEIDRKEFEERMKDIKSV